MWRKGIVVGLIGADFVLLHFKQSAYSSNVDFRVWLELSPRVVFVYLSMGVAVLNNSKIYFLLPLYSNVLFLQKKTCVLFLNI